MRSFTLSFVIGFALLWATGASKAAGNSPAPPDHSQRAQAEARWKRLDGPSRQRALGLYRALHGVSRPVRESLIGNLRAGHPPLDREMLARIEQVRAMDAFERGWLGVLNTLMRAYEAEFAGEDAGWHQRPSVERARMAAPSVAACIQRILADGAGLSSELAPEAFSAGEIAQTARQVSARRRHNLLRQSESLSAQEQGLLSGLTMDEWDEVLADTALLDLLFADMTRREQRLELHGDYLRNRLEHSDAAERGRQLADTLRRRYKMLR